MSAVDRFSDLILPLNDRRQKSATRDGLVMRVRRWVRACAALVLFVIFRFIICESCLSVKSINDTTIQIPGRGNLHGEISMISYVIDRLIQEFQQRKPIVQVAFL